MMIVAMATMKVVAAHESDHLRAAGLVRLVAGLDHLLPLLGVNSSAVVLGERQHRRLERLALQRRRIQRIIPARRLHQRMDLEIFDDDKPLEAQNDLS